VPGLQDCELSQTHYTQEQLCQRMLEVLGRAPSRYQLAKARSAEERPVRSGRPRLTAGMPAPDQRVQQPAWKVKDVEEWLSNHPVKQIQRAKELLEVQLQTVGATHAVAAAREQGLSWEQIAEVLRRVEGRPTLTRQAVILRYGRT